MRYHFLLYWNVIIQRPYCLPELYLNRVKSLSIMCGELVCCHISRLVPMYDFCALASHPAGLCTVHASLKADAD